MEAIIVAAIGAVSALLSAIILKNQGLEKAEREDDRRRMAIIIKGLRAALDGLHQQGANGRVTESLQELDDYINEKASA